MPKQQFGAAFKKGATKTWKESRDAEAGDGSKWGKYDLGAYNGSTTVSVGVYDRGALKGCDYFSFATTFVGGEYEGEEVDARINFGTPRETEAQAKQKLEKVIKNCKALFPELVDEISQCGTPDTFLDLFNSDMADQVVEHEFTLEEFTPNTTPENPNPTPIRFCKFGAVTGAGEADDEEGDDTEEEETEEEEEAPKPKKRATKTTEKAPAPAKKKRAKPAPEPEEEEEEADEEEEDEEEEEGYIPTVGDYVEYKPKGKRIAIEYQVTTINKRKQTATLANEDGDKETEVPWDKLTLLEE